MKTHQVSSSRRKCRKAHFQAHSSLKYKLMSCQLSKDLRKKHGVRSMPVRKDDEVSIQKGTYKGNKGKVTQVYRLRWCIYVEKVQKSKSNGQPVMIPIKANQCIITKLKLDRDRTNLLSRKAQKGQQIKGQKYTEKEVQKK